MRKISTKLLALLLAMTLCLGLSAAAFGAERAEEDPFAGDWVETVAHRGVMHITKDGASYTVQVEWPNSAAEVYLTRMTGAYDAAEDAIVYRMGQSILRTYAADGSYAESDARIGLAGTLKLTEGKLCWLEKGQQEPSIFERLEYLPAEEPAEESAEEPAETPAAEEPSEESADESAEAPAEEEPAQESDSEKPAAELTSDNPFADVTTADYFYDAVLWALKNDITRGTSETAFSPDGQCTRAQVVTFLWRLAGKPVQDTADMPFTDVEADSWYEQAVLWAVAEDITRGTSETTFSPENKTTRGQVLTFLYRLMGEPGVTGETPYTDVKPEDWYADAVLWAEQQGILDRNNTPGADRFAPNEICRRADIVTFLYLGKNTMQAHQIYAHQFLGRWADRTSGRAYLTILPQTETGYGDYVVTLRWGSSAWESRVWTFYAIFEENTGRMFYANGETADITWGDDGSSYTKKVIFDDNTGAFTFAEGELHWNDNREDRSGSMVFEPYYTESPSEEDFAVLFRAAGSYLAGTSGASLKEAEVVCRLIDFALTRDLWTVDVPGMRSAMLKAWESLTEEERAAFDANWMSAAALADQAFSDYESVKELFEDAGVGETMEKNIGLPEAGLCWDALKSHTFTLGNSEG